MNTQWRRKFLGIVGTLMAATAHANEPDGKSIFQQKCAMCHLPEGQGIPPVFPPLAGSDWLMADRERTIKVLCEGLRGSI